MVRGGPAEANPSKHSRTRTGCWTCRRRYAPRMARAAVAERHRKKKCDSETFPCNNCTRLQLTCESQTRLVWEDDSRREGMRRRGPPSLKKAHETRAESQLVADSARGPQNFQVTTLGDDQFERAMTLEPVQSWDRSISPLNCNPSPTNLPPHESMLLDHYIQRFSRTYPTCSGPTNPFVSVFLPLAMQNPVVLDSLLALSGAQTWNEYGFTMERTTLRLRQRALAGFQNLLTQSNPVPNEVNLQPAGTTYGNMSEENFLLISASCILFLLFEKIVGEGKANWLPHLQFMSRLFRTFFRQRTGSNTGPILHSLRNPEAFQFIHHLFLYNDLVHATSRGTATLSDYYLQLEQGPLSVWSNGLPFSPEILPSAPQHDNTLAFPHLIARISAGDENVTDADITAWDGRVQWLPSYSLNAMQTQREALDLMPVMAVYLQRPNPPLTSSDEEWLISDLYRVTANIYRIQMSRKRTGTLQSTADTGTLACQAIQFVLQLPDGSPFENALLWPIGIIAKELTRNHLAERNVILNRLQVLERRFQMRHFERARAAFQRMWRRKDEGEEEQVEKEELLLFG